MTSRVPAVGKSSTIVARRRSPNTVDFEAATYRNSVGQALAGAWWRDPDFDADERAFYYVRVLEIPTPTWLAYDKA